ncbi:MAG: helicase-related protein, partial [Verrucomicrobiales bacterium]|nr:helicase-related protein [Verrucomicrobiales bacterium]
DLLKSRGWAGGMDIFPLFGELPPAQQDQAVESRGRRKIVVATNVAETSLTIDGVRVVIDAGLARMAAFDVRRGINTLTVQKISQAASEQRAGRAGRTAAGVAVRLWSEREHAERRAQEVPEVRRMDLAEVVLTLKACGVVDLDAFRWFEKPGEEALAVADRILCLLGAVDAESGEITGTGQMMTRFPLHPRQARVLIAGAGYGCLNEVALAIALSQGRGIFRRGLRGDQQGARAFAAKSDTSDYVPQLRAWQFAEGKRFDGRDCAELGVNAGAAREAGALVKEVLGICK